MPRPAKYQSKKSPSKSHGNKGFSGEDILPFTENIKLALIPEPCGCTWVHYPTNSRFVTLKFRNKSCVGQHP